MKNLYLLATSMIYAFSSVAQDPSWISDVTNAVGLEAKYGTKMYAADVNGDDYPDLFTIETKNNTEYFNDRQTLHLYINTQNPNGNDIHDRIFVDVSAESGIWSNTDPNDTGRRTTLIALADVDNDGDLDLATGHYFHRLSSFNDIGDRAEILLNDGHGNFSILPNNGLHELGALNCQGLSFLDYDKDGNIDLFMGNWFVDYKAQVGDEYMKDKLLKGNGDGTFTDVSESVGINSPAEPLYGSSCGDWNNDGWVDIFTAPYCRTDGALYQNNGDGTFTNKATEAGYNARALPGDNGQALCMWTAYPYDFDNDEDLDFFFALVHGGLNNGEGRSTIVRNGGEQNGYKLNWDLDRLNHNVPPRPTHMAEYEASWFDIDNDGFIDLIHGQGSYTSQEGRVFIFKQNSDSTFTDIAKDLGFALDKYRTSNRIRTFDYDLDGDMDMLISGGNNNYIHLLKNNKGNDNYHISIKLYGLDGSNSAAIGAKVKLHQDGTIYTKEVNSGYGNAAGQDGFMLTFGLGQNPNYDSITVQWPDINQTVSVYRDLEVNKLHKLGAWAETDNKEELVIFPNAISNGTLRVASPGHFTVKKELYIYDNAGALISKETFNSRIIQTKINLAPGIYIVKVFDDQGESAYAKMVVE